MRVLSEGINKTKIGIQELTSGLLGVQVVIETKDDLAGLVVDGEQEFVLLFAVGEREDGSGGYIRSVELVDDAHIETAGSKQMLEVGTVLRGGFRLGDNVLVGYIVVRKVGNELVTEELQVFSKSHIVLDGGADREHVGEEANNFLKLSHRTLSDGSTNDEGVLGRILVEEQVVDCEEGGEGRGGGGGNVVIVPLERLGMNVTLDLGDRALLNLGRLGEGQDERLDALQLLAPVLDLLIAKLGPTIGSADQPVTEIRVVELDWRKTVDPMDVELEQLVEEDTEGCLIGHDVMNDDVEGVSFATQPVHDGGDEREFVETEIGVHVVSNRHVVRLLIRVGLLAEIDDRGVMDVNRRVDGLHEFTLPLVPVESGPEGTMTVDSLLEGFGHPLEINGDLRVDANEVALVSIPLSSTKALHSGIYYSNVPPSGIFVLALSKPDTVLVG